MARDGKQISLQWSKNLKDPEKIKQLHAAIYGSVTLRERLKEIIRDKMEGLSSSENSESDYDSPSWSHKQAHRNGQRAAFADILKLIDL